MIRNRQSPNLDAEHCSLIGHNRLGQRQSSPNYEKPVEKIMTANIESSLANGVLQEEVAAFLEKRRPDFSKFH